MKPRSGETLDSIKEAMILQSEKGYRFSIDAVILEDFIRAKRNEHGIELGTGSGVISILLAKRFGSIKLTGVEIQKPLALRAEKNVKLNNLSDRIDILRSDINKLKDVFPANKADIVFSNPPFRKTETGKISIDDERAAARHEIKMTLSGLIETAAYLLKDRGRLYIIYHPFRLIELIGLMQRYNLEPKKMRFVHSRQGEEAKMVLIEAVKVSGKWLKILPPLFIHKEGDEYTEDIKKMLGK